jgi:hypothetical protein
MSNEYKDYKRDLFITLLAKMHEVKYLYEGWRKTFIPDMISELCDALGPYVEDFEVGQIKEKYGSLTVYWGWKHRDYTDEENQDRKEIDDAVKSIIDKYRKISEHTCIKCGGKATFFSSHWVVPYCDDCRDRKLGVFAIIEDD